MFNKIWNQSSVSKEKPWSTEKELILYMIDKISSQISEIYHNNAPEEWKINSKYFDTKHSMGKSFRSWDGEKLKYLADHCDDVDILRAVFESDKVVEECYFSKHFVENVNLPDDIIIGLCEKYSSNEDILEQMQRVEYKYITEETKAKIAATIADLIQKRRKRKEDKTKQKLTAFLTTAAATKSVLTGNSIDDVVEQTITSDVDDAVLDYMNKLFDK
jgi:hypothetical protein